MAGVFISYRRGNTNAHAGRLYDRLKDRFGSDRVFMDVDTIVPGTDFVDHVRRAVGSCEAMLVLIGNDWLYCQDEDGRRRLEDPDDFVRLEVTTGLTRGVRVVPVLLQGARVPKASELPEQIAALTRRNAIELSDAGWRDDVERLVEALEPVMATRRHAQRRKARSRRTSSARRLWPAVAAGVLIAGVVGFAVARDHGTVRQGNSAGTVRRTVPVGDAPSQAAVGSGAVWVVNSNDAAVQRLDLNTGAIGPSTQVPGPSQYLAIGRSWLWVTVPRPDGPGSLIRVDLATGERVPPTIRTGPYPAAVAVGGTWVWVVNAGDGTVMKFDQGTGHLVKTVNGGGAIRALAVSRGVVWVPDSTTGTVARIDADRGTLMGDPIHVGNQPEGIAVGAGAVWVANSGADTVSPIDSDPGQVGTPIKVGAGPGELAASDSAVWVVNEDARSVVRIDPHARRVVGRPIKVGRSPGGPAVGAGSVWVPNTNDDTLTQIDPG